MIPKIIHYCWFGKNPLPELAVKCIDSWKRFCPDYEIIRWDESNFDINCNSYLKEAYEAKKWAFVSDYARLRIIYENGGIYFDTDVELIKPIDNLLDEKCFFGSETDGWANTGLGFGAECENPIVLDLLSMYDNRHFEKVRGVYDLTPCPALNTEPLVKKGYVFSKSLVWRNKDFSVFPPEYFCPLDYETGVLTVTNNTYSIHLFSALWVSAQDLEVASTLEKINKSYSGVVRLFEKQKALYVIAKKYGDYTNPISYTFDKIRRKLNEISHN